MSKPFMLAVAYHCVNMPTGSPCNPALCCEVQQLLSGCLLLAFLAAFYIRVTPE